MTRALEVLIACLAGIGTAAVLIFTVRVISEVPADAQFGVSSTDTLEAFADEVLSVAGSSTPLTAATYSGATRADCTVSGQSLSYRVAGGTPAAATGHVIAAGGSFTLFRGDIRRFRAIQVSSTSTLFCSYRK